MGWLSCYEALLLNKCKTGAELERKNFRAYRMADNTNCPRDRKRAWDLASKKIKDEYKCLSSIKKMKLRD